MGQISPRGDIAPRPRLAITADARDAHLQTRSRQLQATSRGPLASGWLSANRTWPTQQQILSQPCQLHGIFPYWDKSVLFHSGKVGSCLGSRKGGAISI